MILDALLGVRSLAESSEGRFWRDVAESWGGKTASGKAVNEDSALTFSAVYRAVALIAGTISTLPLRVYRRVSDTERERAAGNPVDMLLNVSPNEYMDAVTFRETLTANVLTWGNGYAEIVRAGPRPVALYPIASRLVTPKVNAAGRLVYEVRQDDGTTRTLAQRDVLHVRGMSGDGLAGWSVIRKARESIGLGMAAEQFGAAFFGNGSRPSGVLTSPQKLEEKTINRLRAEWDAMQSGAGNAGRPAVLTGGMAWTSISIPPGDAQFLESRKFQVLEVARWFGTPPHLLFDLDRATFSNIEHQGLEWLAYGLGYWLRKWETTVNLALLSEGDLYAEHVTAALVRSDLKARYDAYAVGRNNGWLSVNDILRAENMNTIGEEGDVRLAPVNMVPLENLLMQEEANDAAEGETPANDPSDVPGADQPSEDTSDPGETEAASAMRGLLLATVGRLARRQAAAARQAAKRPGKFLDWLDTWAGHEQDVIAEALGPVLPVLATAGRVRQAADLAGLYASRARETLLDVAGQATPDWLIDGVEQWAAAWERESPEWLAERVRA